MRMRRRCSGSGTDDAQQRRRKIPASQGFRSQRHARSAAAQPRRTRALHDYFSSLNGHRPAHLYDLVLREVEEPLFKAVLDYAVGQPEPRRRASSASTAARCARNCASSACRPERRAASMLVPIRRALLSVSDKTGLVDSRARSLRATSRCSPPAARPSCCATRASRSNEVASHTGFPEIMDGRVKTLHPQDPRRPARPARRRRRGHGEARHRADRPARRESLSVRRRPSRRPDCTYARGHREHRHRRPGDGARRGEESRVGRGGRRSGRLRAGARRARRERRRHQHRHALAPRRQGVRAHGAVRRDGVAATCSRARGRPAERFPRRCRWCSKRCRTCATARTRTSRRRSIASSGARGLVRRERARMLQGKELSFNNIADADTAIECVRQFDEPACVIVKHANPCGVATAVSLARGLRARLSHRSHLRVRRHHRVQPRAGCRHGRRRSSGGSSSRCIAAPSVSRRRRRRCSPASRTCACWRSARSRQRAGSELEYRSVTGGLLVQTRDTAHRAAATTFKIVTHAQAHAARRSRTCCSPGACASS